jgi:hypothetical protein
MSKSDEARIAKLVRKLQSQVSKRKPDKRRRYDDTLQPEAEEAGESQELFREMKKREF